ncbi:MAG: sugar ABC transporter permease [Firmicutes bacterium HGW-Firmicutes-1]|nr:MAG: sugar ABC transporter permease [Firmicutes bacterium HGW-Firmicutes-1]
MSTLLSMLTLTLIFSTPIIIVALGGLFSERAGVVNIALEGLMMIGGFSAATSIVFLEKTIPGLAPWIAIVIGMLVGGLVSLIHAYISVNLQGNQVISGTAINIFAIGITIYLSQVIFHQQRTETFKKGFIKTTYNGLSDIPIIGDVFFTNIYPTVFIALALVVVTWYVVYKTKFGLRLRATGEHPHAADSMGINVYKIRYIGVILSGCLAGLGGGIMILTQDTQYTVMSIHGTGFIALAALIFGKWKPVGVLGASLFFGFSQILSIYSNKFGILSKLPFEFFYALPYILTIIALVVFSGKAVGPKAAGEPYDKGKR